MDIWQKGHLKSERMSACSKQRKGPFQTGKCTPVGATSFITIRWGRGSMHFPLQLLGTLPAEVADTAFVLVSRRLLRKPVSGQIRSWFFVPRHRFIRSSEFCPTMPTCPVRYLSSFRVFRTRTRGANLSRMEQDGDLHGHSQKGPPPAHRIFTKKARCLAKSRPQPASMITRISIRSRSVTLQIIWLRKRRQGAPTQSRNTRSSN